MGFETAIERREISRMSPAPARAVAGGDSLLVAASWKRWADGAAIERWDALALNAAEPNPFFESWYLLPALRRFDKTKAESADDNLIILWADGTIAEWFPWWRRLL